MVVMKAIVVELIKVIIARRLQYYFAAIVVPLAIVVPALAATTVTACLIAFIESVALPRFGYLYLVGSEATLEKMLPFITSAINECFEGLVVVSPVLGVDFKLEQWTITEIVVLVPVELGLQLVPRGFDFEILRLLASCRYVSANSLVALMDHKFAARAAIGISIIIEEGLLRCCFSIFNPLSA